MTASDWTTSTDPQEMLTFLQDREPSRRKLRLFSLLCCRRLNPLLTDPRVLVALHAVEHAIDALAQAELVAAHAGLQEAVEEAWIERYGAEADANFCARPGYSFAQATESAVYAVSQLFDEVSPASLFPTRERGRSHELAIHDLSARAVAAHAEATGIYIFPSARPRKSWKARQRLCEAFVSKVRWSERLVQTDALRDIFGSPFRPVFFAPEWRTEAVVALARGIYDDRAWDRMAVLGDALEDAGCDITEVLEHSRGPSLHHRGCWLIDEVLQKT